MTSGVSRRGLLAGGVSLAALAACSKPTAAAKTSTREEFVIGANLELTGVGATLGTLQERALRIAAAEANSAGLPYGDKRLSVRLVIKDNRSDPTTAGDVSRQLIEQEGVCAVIGGTMVETSMNMIAVHEPQKVPLLCLSGGDDIALPLPNRKFIYKLAPNASDVASVLADSLKARQLSRVAVLATSDGHGEAGAQAMPRALNAAGVSHVGTVRLPASGQSYSDSARRLIALQPEAVVVWAMAPISGAAVAALREAGYGATVFLDSGAGADETLNGPHSAAVEGSYLVAPTVLGGASVTATTPSQRAARDFIYRYIQEYGSFAGFAPYAADALNLLAVAARRGLSLDPQRLRGRLEAGAVETISGSYAFQPIAHGGIEPDALVLFAVRQGAWVRL